MAQTSLLSNLGGVGSSLDKKFSPRLDAQGVRRWMRRYAQVCAGCAQVVHRCMTGTGAVDAPVPHRPENRPERSTGAAGQRAMREPISGSESTYAPFLRVGNSFLHVSELEMPPSLSCEKCTGRATGAD